MRALLRRLHRWCGLVIAVLLLACSVTGSIIAFEHELDAALNPALFRTGNAQPALPLDALITRIEAQDPRLRVTQLPLDTRPGQASEVQVQAREGIVAAPRFDRLFVDPSSGRVLGARQWGAWQWDRAHLLPWFNRLHRTLTLPGRIGNQLLGTMAILWLFLSLSGLVLTLPARWSQFWHRWKPAWQVKRGIRGFRLVNDLHRAMGLWLLPVALCSAFTGIYLNLGNEVFKPIAGLFGPISPHPVAGLAHLASARPVASVLTPEQAVSAARKLLPDAAQHYAPWYMGHLAPRGAYRVAFKEAGMREQALRVRYEQVFIDDQTGALLGRFGYLSGTATDRFLVWMYPLHSGKSWGLPGRLAIALSGLCVALVCMTGILRWLKRRGMGH
jgi:uncharacterized iron-regulated membrane protein